MAYSHFIPCKYGAMTNPKVHFVLVGSGKTWDKTANSNAGGWVTTATFANTCINLTYDDTAGGYFVTIPDFTEGGTIAMLLYDDGAPTKSSDIVGKYYFRYDAVLDGIVELPSNRIVQVNA
jgi:hypothetical protein